MFGHEAIPARRSSESLMPSSANLSRSRFVPRPRFHRFTDGNPASMQTDAEADRIRSLILLRATCETVLAHLDEDDIDDLALTVQISELCDTLSDELARVANRNTSA
jgi:hypothetical protein